MGDHIFFYKLCIIPNSPIQSEMMDNRWRKTFLTMSSSKFYPTLHFPTHTCDIMYGTLLSGTSIVIHTTLLRLSGNRSIFNGNRSKIQLIYAYRQFWYRRGQLLRLTVISKNDLIHCVCGHLYERQNIKYIAFSRICSYLKAGVFLLSEIPATYSI